ncbi:MAG: diaminopimelate epimerase [Spirochaetia bacterium]|jgi:diaminopimelate epimerase|nr:diaminopimelate epimerase [Spirochaetales bacterium]MDX9783572.1 diaminopimelate epimerase [Spirochaetia bacterium]
MNIQFRKYQALGNDYIVIDPREFPFIPEGEAIRAVCDRNFGAGSDGILFGPLSRVDDLEGLPAGRIAEGLVPWLRIFNPDGSEAEKSGNGLRIFCLYLAERGYVDSDPFHVDTKGGRVFAQVESIDPPSIRIDMGKPSFSAKDAGLTTDAEEFVLASLDLSDRDAAGGIYEASFVSMGNPHCVIFVEEPTAALAKRLGPLVERHPLFPEATNVQFAKVLDRHSMRIEIWERGAGYTLASGSSSCAAASVAKRLGMVEGRVTMNMPGGMLELDLSSDSVLMTGPALRVFDGCFSESLLLRLRGLGALR